MGRAEDYHRIVAEYGYVSEYSSQVQRELDALEVARLVAQANRDQLVRVGEDPWVTRYGESATGSDGTLHIPLYHFHGYFHRRVPQYRVERIGCDEFHTLALHSVMSVDFFRRLNILKQQEMRPNTLKNKSKVRCHACGRDIFPKAAESCPKCNAAKCVSGHCLCGTLWDETYRRAVWRNLLVE